MVDATALQLLDLLDQERSTLKAGSFDKLDEIVAMKANVLQRLGQEAPGREHLAQIKRQLSENQQLLGAAINGVSAARDRLAALQNVRDGLNVYNQGGQKAKVSTSRPGFDKKA